MYYKSLGDKTVQNWINDLGSNGVFNALSQNQKILYIDREQQECAMLSKENKLGFYKVTEPPTKLFAQDANGGVYIFSDNGFWTLVGSHDPGHPDLYIHMPLIAFKTYLFAGTYGSGIFRSPDNGITWEAVNTGLTNLHVFDFAILGENIFACTEATNGGVFISTDNGANWTKTTTIISGEERSVYSILVSGSNLYAGLPYRTIYVSIDNGLTWDALTYSGEHYVRTLAVNSTYLFGGWDVGGVYRSSDNGTSWTQVNTGLTNTTVYSLYISGTELFAGTESDGLFLSIDNGDNWSTLLAPSESLSYVYSIVIFGNDLFAATSFGVYHFTKIGSTWTYVDKLFVNVDVRAFALKTGE